MSVLAVLLFAAAVRLLWLDSIPPGLWYDEAIYALDGYDVSRGRFPIFFETYGHMREPLYIYSLGGAFALFGPSTYTARLVSATWGIGAVALFFPVARRIFGARWGLLAMFAFAAFRWHAHFSRTIFRALLPSFFMLLVVWLFLRWTEKRRMRDAVACGVALGAGFYTYLSFRFAPLILAVWIGWLLWKKQIQIRRDAKHLAALFAAAFLVFCPLGLDYLKNPEHFFGRTGEISMFEKTVQQLQPDGSTADVKISKPFLEAARDLGGNLLDVAGMWTVRGDHVGKHNLPYAPVFDWLSGAFFYAGLLWCVLRFRQSQYACLLLAWLFFFSLTSIFSFGAPNLLRMQGASPAAILIYVAGLRWAFELLPRKLSPLAHQAVVILLVLFFAALQVHIYFVRFPKSVTVRNEFTADIFYAPAEAARQATRTSKQVYVPEELAATPVFKFVTAGLPNIQTYPPNHALPVDPGPQSPGTAYLVTMRSMQLAQKAGHDHLRQLNAMPGARRIRRLLMPIADANDQVARKHEWAELWQAGNSLKNP